MDLGSLSMATTSPEGPTSRAVSIATSPTPRPHIQNAVAGSNVRLTKEPFGDGSDTRSLPDQALVLGISVAQGVISGAMACRHLAEGCYQLRFHVAVLD